MIKSLVEELGADVNRALGDGGTPLMAAVQEGHFKVVQCLVNELGADVNTANANGCTLLILAVMKGHLTLAKHLVKELGVNSNRAKNDGHTPLCIAAQNGNKQMVVCLVEELGAKVNLATKDDMTPLMLASGKKYEKIIRYLLKNGADVQASLTKGGLVTAVDVSKHYGAPAEQTAYIEARTHCANPGCDGAGLKKCANCKEIFFCSKDCQVASWPMYKVNCKRRVDAKSGKKS
jgi:ankyrin repeat protein